MKEKDKKRCAHCGEKSLTNPRAIYCSKSCKTLAWMERKKQGQENGLAGTEENESATEQYEKPVPVITQVQQAQIPKTNSQPTDFPVEDFSFAQTQEIPQQKTTTPQTNFLTADQKLFSQLDDEFGFDRGETENKTQPFSWNTDSKTNQAENPRKKNPAWRDDLRLDQRMAFEQTNGFDYDELFSTYSEKQVQQPQAQSQHPNIAPVLSNGATGWQPQLFTEPEPVPVMPVYDTRKVKRRTVQGEKAVKDATENLDRLRRIYYENSTLRTLFNTLSQKVSSILRAWNRLPDEKRLSLVEVWSKRNTFDSLLADGTGHDIDGHISFDLPDGTTQENATQRIRINKRLSEYVKEWESRLEKAKEFYKLINAQSSFIWVEENYIVNKDECDLYEKNYQAWRERKKSHDEKQIRDREEYIKQQQKIQQLGNIPQIEQAILPQQSNNTITNNTITNNSQSTIKAGANPLQPPNVILSEKKQFQVNTPIKKSTIGLIVNSRDVHMYAGEMLQLTGRHGKFIGNPPRRFMMVVHGQPGAGKSTYSCQIGKYFADSLGKVIYVSGEEGLSATLEARLIRTDGKSDKLSFVDCRCLKDIFDHVRKNKFSFIIIDSLKHLGIDYAGMLELKNYYENESIIFIQQSTKDGKMAGEQALKHEIDIEIIVSGGYAEIGKTRADN
ncbi:MAG: DNA repair protein RadA, partial [Bacteroidota bacterium]|nr:DNA repair protein RadA [Bacteroidota bacterium]